MACDVVPVEIMEDQWFLHVAAAPHEPARWHGRCPRRSLVIEKRGRRHSAGPGDAAIVILVDYGRNLVPVPRERYERSGYGPPYDQLPTKMSMRK